MTHVDPRPKPRSRWRRAIKFLAIGGIALLLLAVLARSIWDYQSAAALHRELQAIRDQNQPLTFADLKAAAPKVDPETDAGRLYTAAMALLLMPDPDFNEVDAAYGGALEAWPTTQPDTQARAKARRLLDANSQALALVDRAAACPTCQCDLGVPLGLDAVLPKLGRARALANLVSIRTKDLLLAGKSDAAVDSAIACMGLTGIPDQQPILIVYVVKLSLAANAAYRMRNVIENGHLSEPLLVRLQQSLDQAESLVDLQRAMVNERVFILAEMRNLIQEDPQLEQTEQLTPWRPTWETSWWSRPAMRSLMLVGSLHDMARAIRVVHEPWPAPLDDMERITADKDALSLFGRVAMPAIVSGVTSSGNALAIIRCCRVSAMVERYRLAHHQLPDALTDLVPAYAAELPPDPFTGKSMLYRRDATGYTIYSTGEDRHDDGGLIEDHEKPGHPKDRGIRIRVLPH